jgi:hypothetical protein
LHIVAFKGELHLRRLLTARHLIVFRPNGRLSSAFDRSTQPLIVLANDSGM